MGASSYLGSVGLDESVDYGVGVLCLQARKNPINQAHIRVKGHNYKVHEETERQRDYTPRPQPQHPLSVGTLLLFSECSIIDYGLCKNKEGPWPLAL